MGTLPDVDTTCRLCVGQHANKLTSLQPYIPTLCKLGEFSLDPRLPQKVCGNCLPLVEIAESLRQSIADVEPFWSQCLTMKRDAASSSGLELQIVDVRGAVDEGMEHSSFPVDLNRQVKQEPIDIDEMTEEEEGALSPFSQQSDDDEKSDSEGTDEGNSSQRSLQRRISKGRVKCFVCKAVFSNGNECREHLATVHQKASVVCDDEDCGKVFPSRSHLWRHKYHATSKRFKCSYEGCKSAFSAKQTLQIHVRAKHTGEKPFECLHCQRGFISTSRRNVHQKTCKGPPQPKIRSDVKVRIPCPICGSSICTRAHLRNHIKTNHPDHSVCSNCFGTFDSPEELAEHNTVCYLNYTRLNKRFKKKV